MATKSTTEEIRNKLAKMPKRGESAPPIVQEARSSSPAPEKKTGRKSHRLEGVEYARVGASVPAYLKTEMEVAIRTTHKECPTIDTFIAEAMRHFLALKK